MMAEYPNISAGTKESPRFVSDTLVFYQGDVFDIEFIFELTADGVPVMLGETDRIRFEFYRMHCLPDTVTVEIPGTDIIDNAAILHWTDELTKEFRRGFYEYRIRLISESQSTTLTAHGQMIVE